MQPPAIDDLASRPLHALQRMLANYDGRNHGQLFSTVAAHFGKLGASDHIQQVPILSHDTADTIPANTLVRFRGMVVDMFNPEFFVGAYRATGGPWRAAALYTGEHSSCNQNTDLHTIAESTLLCPTCPPHVARHFQCLLSAWHAFHWAPKGERCTWHAARLVQCLRRNQMLKQMQLARLAGPHRDACCTDCMVGGPVRAPAPASQMPCLMTWMQQQRAASWRGARCC
eukprot:GHRQ01031238.1.p1 GENE.GHRQ01031238.1~~GHRQ01031238.1.p1  ORF type:complete len:258 (+),score=5.72 GHRQ01031238.1:92-775(+)